MSTKNNDATIFVMILFGMLLVITLSCYQIHKEVRRMRTVMQMENGYTLDQIDSITDQEYSTDNNKTSSR